MKKLFKSYTYEFDNNERKIITSFCKQAIQQMQTDTRFAQDIRSFQSIMTKINSGEEVVKLTKDEAKRLSTQMEENVKHIKKQMDKSWFLKKWFYRSVLNQYNSLIENHFSN